jgi:hypothetical protein
VLTARMYFRGLLRLTKSWNAMPMSVPLPAEDEGSALAQDSAWAAETEAPAQGSAW